MMSLSSSQAGIVGARRKKLNSTQFSSYRYVKVEYNNPISFILSPPSAKYSFTARHIYSYSKINNTFTLLGVQKAQSLIRKDYYQNITIDNTTLNNINNNRLYTNTNADLSREQLIPDVNFNINTANIFDTKNLANNEKVFVDVRWINFIDNERKNSDGWWENDIGGCVMNNKKGNIYRVGIIIKDNTIDSMLYHTDLATNEALRKKMQKEKDLTLV
jgi:hypothetical protein